MTNNKIVAITSVNGCLNRSIHECNCGLPQDGFRFIFKNTKDMELFIKFFEDLESKSK